MYGAYNPPSELGISMHATVNSNASYIQTVQDKTKKQDARFVKLQKVEHAIMESELIKYCLYISMVGILITFVYLLLNMKERLYLEIGIRTIQVWGYVYGLQAWYYKDRDMAKVLVYYLYVSFLLIPCQANYNFAIKSDFWRMLNVILDCFLFFFNILQLILARRLSKNLEERKRLRRELGKF